MTLALDQIARLASSLSPAGRVRIVIEVEPEGKVAVEAESGSSRTGERTPARHHAHRAGDRHSDVIKWLEVELSKRPARDFSFELLDSAEVGRRMARAGLPPLRGKATNTLLKAAGFVNLGRMQGPKRTANYWSVYPEKFRDQKGKLLTHKVREHLRSL